MKHIMQKWYDKVGRLPCNEDLNEVTITVEDGVAAYTVRRNEEVLRAGYLNESQLRGLRRFYKKRKSMSDLAGWGMSGWNDFFRFYRVFPTKRRMFEVCASALN